jgi:hypothetical protein
MIMIEDYFWHAAAIGRRLERGSMDLLAEDN